MTNPVYITGANAITSLGPDLESLFDGLLDKRSGISPVRRFDTSRYASPDAGIIDVLDTESPHPLILQLADRLINQLGSIDPETYLIVSSTKAGIERLDDAALRTGTVPDSLLLSGLTTYISEKIGLTHGGININSACASSTIAIAKGAALIESGAEDAVLVCCMDVVSQFVFSGFSALGAMSSGPARPFDRKRNGLTLGEGAAAIMLMNRQTANRLGKPALARVAGWGIAGDAEHLTAPAKDGSGLKQAIRAACKKAGVNTHDITAFNTHGTGTVYNDAMELHVMNGMFDTGKLSANSVKGAIGHTLGAAGGIEAALCVDMLEKRTLLPTVGLNIPEKGAEKLICREARSFNGGRILTTNSGFGGINAALVIEAVTDRPGVTTVCP